MSSCATCNAPCGGCPDPNRIVIDDANIAQAQSGMIGGFYIRPMRLVGKGATHEGHAHWIDHVSNILRGPLQIDWFNPKTGQRGVVEVSGPCKILVKADVEHRFTALGDVAEWECWFAEAHNAGDKPVTFHQERSDG